jgi:hypothetical protein
LFVDQRAAWELVDALPPAAKFEFAVLNPGLVLGPAVLGAASPARAEAAALQDGAGAVVALRAGQLRPPVDALTRLLTRAIPAVPELAFSAVDVRDLA